MHLTPQNANSKPETLFVAIQYEIAISMHKLAWHPSSGLVKGAQKGQQGQ